MERIKLVGTDLTVSKLILGTASLHQIGGLSTQRDHISSSIDMGFSHVDTAPLYGFGQSERAYGMLSRTDRDNISITTKICLYPPGSGDASRLTTVFRKVGGKLMPRLSRPIASQCLDRAVKSFECSLKRIKRDYVDILLVHEPEHQFLMTDEWLSWITSESRFRYFGACGASKSLSDFIDDYSDLLSIIQAPDMVSDEGFPLLSGRIPQITYGYLSSKRRGEPRKIIDEARLRNIGGAVIVASRKVQRLQKLVV